MEHVNSRLDLIINLLHVFLPIIYAFSKWKNPNNMRRASRVLRVDLCLGQAVSLQVCQSAKGLCHDGVRVAEQHCPRRTGHFTGRSFRKVWSGAGQSVVTEVALSHFCCYRDTCLHIPVPWNFIKFTLLLTRFDSIF